MSEDGHILGSRDLVSRPLRVLTKVARVWEACCASLSDWRCDAARARRRSLVRWELGSGSESPPLEFHLTTQFLASLDLPPTRTIPKTRPLSSEYLQSCLYLQTSRKCQSEDISEAAEGVKEEVAAAEVVGEAEARALKQRSPKRKTSST